MVTVLKGLSILNNNHKIPPLKAQNAPIGHITRTCQIDVPFKTGRADLGSVSVTTVASHLPRYSPALPHLLHTEASSQVPLTASSAVSESCPVALDMLPPPPVTGAAAAY